MASFTWSTLPRQHNSYLRSECKFKENCSNNTRSWNLHWKRKKITWSMRLFVHSAVGDFIDNNIMISYLVPLHNRGHPVCKSMEKFYNEISLLLMVCWEIWHTNAVYLFSYLNVIGRHRTKGEFPLRISHDLHWENKTYELGRSIFITPVRKESHVR